jgi:circadian clock protein KaiC
MTTSHRLEIEDQASGRPPADRRPTLPKAPTGISGLDEVTGGGLPRGRSTLICGPAGCGKTLVGMEFLVRGIIQYGEPGVFVAFEETAEDLTANVASLGFDLVRLQAEGQLAIDHIGTDSADVVAGEWDLEGLFFRIGAAIDRVGAKRVVIDTIENLFGAFSDAAILRTELRRLFDWLKKRAVTTIITGERGGGSLTRHGIEEYVSDCVIVLDHRVTAETSTRRLRILKYRGSHHGTNEYPFLIEASGVSVVPITSQGLGHSVSSERVSSGVDGLDVMVGGGGFYKGSTILINGTAGTGKSTLAAQFCDAACRRGERALYFSFEESEAEIIRNMASVGLDLKRWVDGGLLRFKCFRPSLLGLEAHLYAMQKLVGDFAPAVVVKDPVSDLLRVATGADVASLLTRQVDYLKSRGVTALFTSLNTNAEPGKDDPYIASLVDTLLIVKATEDSGEHTRLIYVLKSRGMAHSNQIRELLITDHGIELAEVYAGPQGLLTGSARRAHEAQERADGTSQGEDLKRRRTHLARRRASVEAQVATLWRGLEDETDGTDGTE